MGHCSVRFFFVIAIKSMKNWFNFLAFYGTMPWKVRGLGLNVQDKGYETISPVSCNTLALISTLFLKGVLLALLNGL